MGKCCCYVKNSLSNTLGYCMRTKEIETCSCQGDESKCDFYPEKRNKKMTTLEMMNKAQETGRTYKCNDMLYSHFNGFHYASGEAWDACAFDKINDVLALEWEPPKSMTKAEAEAKYNILIID